MNAGTIQATVTAQSSSPQQASLSADRAADVYAAWKSVLDRMHSEEQSRPDHDDQRARTMRLGTQTRQSSKTDVMRSNVIEPQSIDAMPACESAVRRWTEVMPTSRSSHASILQPTGQPPSLPDVVAPQASVVPRDLESHGDSPSTVRSATVVPEETNEPFAEFAQVLVRDGNVGIVVRSLEIAPESALQCAFATASELTGRRAALEQLTVNGQVLYRRSVNGSSAEPARTISFIC